MPRLTKPLTAQLEITDRCNFKCRHCYHLDFPKNFVSNDIKDDEMLQLVEILVKESIFSVVLTGGEPLIRKEVVKQAVKYLKLHNVEVVLNTNLIAMDQDTISNLLANNIDGILVSCPAADPEIYQYMTGGGDYWRFEEKLKLLISMKTRFSVNMVVNKYNLSLIKQTAKKMHELGVKFFGATPMGLNSHSPDLKNFMNKEEVAQLVEHLISVNSDLGLNVDIFEALPKCVFSQEVRDGNWPFLKRRCQAGKTIVSVSNNGEVRPCSHNNQSYGNLFNQSMSYIWQKMEEWRGNQKIPTQCLVCESVKSCFGGCRITALTITNDNQGLDPWMTSQIKKMSPQYKKAIVPILTPQTVITVSEIFRWRKEGEDAYLVTSKRGNRNITMINGEYFRFLTKLRECNGINLHSLATKFGIIFEDVSYQRIITELTAKGFVNIQQ